MAEEDKHTLNARQKQTSGWQRNECVQAATKMTCVQENQLSSHVPIGLQGLVEITLGANHVGGKAADAVGASANGILLDG